MCKGLSASFLGLSTRNICNLSRLWQYRLCSYLLPKTAKTFDYVTFGKSVPDEGNFRNTLLTEWDIQVFTTCFFGTDHLLDAPDCMYTSTWIVPTTGLKPTELVLKEALCWIYPLSNVQVHITHCRFHKEQHWAQQLLRSALILPMNLNALNLHFGRWASPEMQI
jgi:hypothetical protein